MSGIPLALVRIRSQLQYISQEFANLTVAELRDGKFSLWQRIFMEILKYSPTLRDREQCAKCIELIEKRSKGIKYCVKKEDRIEFEHTFRLNFMTVIQDVLVCLAWPPACEAFSDILTPLMTDPAVVMAAIEFLLSTVVPVALKSAHTSTAVPTKTSTPLKSKARPVTTSSQNDKQNAVENVAGNKDASPLQSPTKSPMKLASPLPRMQGGQLEKEEDLSRSAYSALKKSFLILQHQNEYLTKQLVALQECISLRDEYEVRMENVLVDLRLSSDSVGDARAKSESTMEGESLRTTLSQWTEIRRDLKRKIADHIEVHPSSRKFLRQSSGSNCRPIGLLATLLGVRRKPDPEDCSLDQSQVHVLQGNLIEFNETVLGILALGTDVYTKGDAQDLVHLQELLGRMSANSCDLLLRLSCFAPLSKADNTNASYASALHVLTEEIHSVAGNKMVPTQVQFALERCMAEQQALVRAYNVMKQAAKQWAEVFENVSDTIRGFGNGTVNYVAQEVSSMQTLERSLQHVCASLEAAESSRIDDPKRGTKVNPLDALSRGVLGAEAGGLVNALRMHAPHMRHVVSKLADFSTELGSQVSREKAVWSRLNSSLATGLARTIECVATAPADHISLRTPRPPTRESKGRRGRGGTTIASAADANRPVWTS